MTYDTGYQNEPIGDGNPYYRCVHCKVSDPEINGDISKHQRWCKYRQSKESSPPVAVQEEGDAWQPIETAPKGANCVAFMVLAWGPEGDSRTGDGMRIGDSFFAAGVFYRLGQQKPYEFRETEVKPTHWRPRPELPAAMKGDKP